MWKQRARDYAVLLLLIAAVSPLFGKAGEQLLAIAALPLLVVGAGIGLLAVLGLVLSLFAGHHAPRSTR
jgi:hypothetical protein